MFLGNHCWHRGKLGSRQWCEPTAVTKAVLWCWKRRLTPGALICDCGLDVYRHGWKRSDGDGEDEAHGQGHHPDLTVEHRRGIIPLSSSSSYSYSRARLITKWDVFLRGRISFCSQKDCRVASVSLMHYGLHFCTQSVFWHLLMCISMFHSAWCDFTCLKMLNTDTLGLASSSITRLTTGRFSAGLSRVQKKKKKRKNHLSLCWSKDKTFRLLFPHELKILNNHSVGLASVISVTSREQSFGSKWRSWLRAGGCSSLGWRFNSPGSITCTTDKLLFLLCLSLRTRGGTGGWFPSNQSSLCAANCQHETVMTQRTLGDLLIRAYSVAQSLTGHRKRLMFMLRPSLKENTEKGS